MASLPPPEPAIFLVSTFPSKTNPTPTLHGPFDWSGLVQAIGRHEPALRKDGEMYSPTEFHPGHGPNIDEGDTYVVGVHFGVFDFDDLHETKLPQVLAVLESARIAHLVLSTWSHTGRRKYENIEKYPNKYLDRKGNRTPALPGIYYHLRIIVPFNRKALASEWHRFWDVLVERLFGDIGVDRSCKATTQRYYSPTYDTKDGAAPIYALREGDVIDVDALVESLGPPLPEASPVVIARGEKALTKANLALIGRTLKASRSEAKKEIGVAIMNLVDGAPFATSEQDTTPLAYKMVREIRDRHPSATEEAVIAHFLPSLAQMSTKLTVEDLRQQFNNKEPNLVKIDMASRIAEAFNGARGEPYVPEDIQEMAEDLSCSTRDMLKRWIIQKGSSYYVLCDGQYYCYSESDVGNAVLRDLAPAATVGIDLYEMTQRGQRRKSIAELVEGYGTVAVGVEVDMTAQRSRYDAITRSFVEAPCPVRVTAKYDADVDQWLRHLAGPEKVNVLFDWIASITQLDIPCAALYLEGLGGTGKSFLAHALARIFTADGAPTPLREAMADFNELMTSCPIVFADETMPTDSRGRLQTGEIREFVQARVRPLRRKYKPAATLKGALRLILAANNRSLLDTNESLTENDISALGERFVHIVVQPEARDFIAAQDTDRWMAEDRVARHAMWLVENWEVNKKGRFIVAGESQGLVASLTTQTGLRASVCQWATNFLLKPTMFFQQFSRDRLIVADQGRLLVSTRAIHEAWTMYIQDKGTPPTPTMLSRALGGISKATFIREGIVVRRYREFSLDALESWGEVTGYIDAPAIRDAIAAIEREQTRSNNMRTN